MQSFSELKLSPGTLDAVTAMGYVTPSPIQALSIPHFLAGRDLLAQARTGTGKTAAFGIPLIEATRAMPPTSGASALVLVPTRELAIQVADELNDIAKGSRVRIVAVYGGVGMGRQIEELRKAGTMILVATPGRLLDHLRSGSARIEKTKLLVLDEADRMLDMGFLPDVERILKACAPVRQTAMFSATVPEPIRRLSQKFLKDPVPIRVETGEVSAPKAEQFKVYVEKANKSRALLALLKKESPDQVMVFTRTKHLAKRLAPALDRAGVPSVALQGNMSQGQRERAMQAFRDGTAKILVATDIAGRGIDVPETSHVVNFDLPDEPEAYVHRIGRTARMGRAGRAFTFVQSDEHHDLRTIERLTGVPMQPYDVGELPADLPPAPKGVPMGSNGQPIRDGGFRHGGHSGHGGRNQRRDGPGHHAKKAPRSDQQGGPRHEGPSEHHAVRAARQDGFAPRRDDAARAPDPRYAPGHDPKQGGGRGGGFGQRRGGGGGGGRRDDRGSREQSMGSGSGTRLGDNYSSGGSGGGRRGGGRSGRRW
jgi:ATP-dependent RNA helicase RhlE